MAKSRAGWLWVVRQSKYAPMEKILIAQSKHETGNWTSKLFKEYHNLFGMKYDKSFPGDSYQGPLSPEGDYYAGYNSWADSAAHLIWWLNRKDIPVTTNVADYTKSIQDKGYFTAGLVDYTEGVKRYI